MSGSANIVAFRWENVEQFISLVNLLILRNASQLGPSNGKENDEAPEVADDGARSSASSAGGEDELKQRFLDRFAEVMSPDKGGKHVCCVALRESGDRRVEENVRISLLVARNNTCSDFSDDDLKFCRTVEKLLRAIATSVDEKIENLDAVKTVLWEELCRYNGPRLGHYANSLRKSIREFKHTGLLDHIPPYKSMRLPSSTDGKPSTFCDDNGLGLYSKSTHDAYMKFSQNHIREFDRILTSGENLAQRALLAAKAYSLRHMSSLRLLVNSCSKTGLANKLMSDILFLGRLRSCYFTLMYGAQNIPGFRNLSVVVVQNTRPRICPSTLPSLTDAMNYLGLILDPVSVRNFVSTQLGVIGAERNFEQLQNHVSRKHLYVHAELQLVLHIVKTMDIETMNREMYPYLGCSKLSCFLCTSFLKSFGPNDALFRTRGCHGRIYRQWSIPDVKDLPSDMEVILRSALTKMRNILVHEIIKPIMSASQLPESSMGLTDVHSPRSSYIRQYHKELAAQRQFDLMRAKLSGRSVWYGHVFHKGL
ncbi:hypothetical protein ID866_10224 [Astraeus odoratus]|nr:hypothetical protein ID866_10224 [Astraeus odoratus]